MNYIPKNTFEEKQMILGMNTTERATLERVISILESRWLSPEERVNELRKLDWS